MILVGNTCRCWAMRHIMLPIVGLALGALFTQALAAPALTAKEQIQLWRAERDVLVQHLNVIGDPNVVLFELQNWGRLATGWPVVPLPAKHLANAIAQGYVADSYNSGSPYDPTELESRMARARERSDDLKEELRRRVATLDRWISETQASDVVRTPPAPADVQASAAIEVKPSRTFANPKVDGYALDWCREWGQACGKPAADKFCEEEGYSEAIQFQPQSENNTPPTKTIGDKKVCSESYCDSITSVTCR